MQRYASLRQGLVGAWCPSVSGPYGYRLPDLSGYGNHGTLTNMTASSSWVPGGLKFSETQNRVYMSKPGIQIMPGYQWAVSLWMRSSGSQPSGYGGYLVADYDLANTTSIAIRVRDSTNIEAWSQDGAGILNVSNVVTTGELMHLCFVSYAIDNRILYKNGLQIGTHNVSHTRSSSGILAIGSAGEYANLDLTFRGEIYDVRMYSRILSTAEIRLLASERGIGLKPERQRNRYLLPVTTPSRNRSSRFLGFPS